MEARRLLTGNGVFIDDLPAIGGTLHAAFVRSPIAHGRILGIDRGGAQAIPGLVTALTGEEIARTTHPLGGGEEPTRRHALAIDLVRHAGEAIAVVCAETPYLAADAAAAIHATFDPLPAVVDLLAAMSDEAPILHDAIGGNVVFDRVSSFGDPRAAFARADQVVAVTVRFPPGAALPVECPGVIASYDASEDAYDVTANVRGSSEWHAGIAAALGVPSSRVHLHGPPHSGDPIGSMPPRAAETVAVCALARRTGRPIKWVEDRLEHLSVGASAPGRVVTLRAAVRQDGLMLGLDWDEIYNCGAYAGVSDAGDGVRRALTGPYRVAHLALRRRAVVTNTPPATVGRSPGEPQISFALARVTAKIAAAVGREPLDVIARNLIAAEEFPYRTATGLLYASGNYEAAIELAERADVLPELRHRRDAARAEGRAYGIGIAATVPPAPCADGGDTSAPNDDVGDETQAGAMRGLVLDLCGVEVDAATGRLRIDRYVTIHDSGGMRWSETADSRVRGCFANAVGAAIFETRAYGPSGSFLSGTLESTSPPTAAEIPTIEIHHLEPPSASSSPKGGYGGDGNAMSTPAALSNAVADALQLDDIELPLGPARVLAMASLTEPRTPGTDDDAAVGELSRTDHAYRGKGASSVPATPEAVWGALHDRETLNSILPRCRDLAEVSPGRYRGTVVASSSVIKSSFEIDVTMADIELHRQVRFVGTMAGFLGRARGELHIGMRPEGDGARITYCYGVDVSGHTAAVGERHLDGACRFLFGEFFRGLSTRFDRAAPAPDNGRRRGWLSRLLRRPTSGGPGHGSEAS